jgi:Tol biopolymer transport system component
MKMLKAGGRRIRSRVAVVVLVCAVVGLGCGDDGTAPEPDPNNDPVTNARFIGEGVAPSWSPDGLWIAASTEGYVVIYSVDGQTPPRNLTTTPPNPSNDWDDSRPDWSPDGTLVAFEGKGRIAGDPGDVWTYPAAGGDPQQVTTDTNERERDPSWSPDGSMIAYWNYYDYSLRVIPSGGGTPEAYPQFAGFSRVAWAPGSNEFAYPDADTLRAVRIGDKHTRVIAATSDPAWHFGGCTWSPDGTTIAVVQYGPTDPFSKGIYTVPAAGGAPSLLVNRIAGVSDNLEDPDWSPDGKWLAFRAYINPSHQQIWIKPVNS